MTHAHALRRAFEEDGYVLTPAALSTAEVAALRLELDAAIQAEVAYHGTEDYPDYGMVLVCPLYGPVMRDLLAHPAVMAPFEAVLGEGCIVYAYISSSMPPASSHAGRNYSVRVHVDCPRLIPGYVTNMGVTIALDDFTEDNGATYFLPGSHERAAPPSDEEFYRTAKRFIAPAGSLLHFNARLWHSGGINRTSEWRHGLTINMCRPYMKQRMDLPRLLRAAHVDLSGADERVLQKLGFFAQPPASYEEYYAPIAQRPFRQKAE